MEEHHGRLPTCPECHRGLTETAAGIGYYCLTCHLAFTLSLAGGYALMLRDGPASNRIAKRIPLASLFSLGT